MNLNRNANCLWDNSVPLSYAVAICMPSRKGKVHLNGFASAVLYVFAIVAVTILQDVFVIHRDRGFAKVGCERMRNRLGTYRFPLIPLLSWA